MSDQEVVETEACPHCGRPYLELMSAEEIGERLQGLESSAVTALEQNLVSLDERVRQAAAKMLLEFTRGKPKQTVESRNDNITRIVYESAAWVPDPQLPGPEPATQDEIRELEAVSGGTPENPS